MGDVMDDKEKKPESIVLVVQDVTMTVTGGLKSKESKENDNG
jgi:hypothetical protein